MSSHTTILVFSDWYLPGYKAGGPIRSIANMVARLDLNFSIVTSIFDHDSTTPYPGISTNKWLPGPQNERVMYLSEEQQTARRFRELMNELDYDCIYLNSLFSTKFALKPLMAARRSRMLSKVILAPRGMLKTGALSVKAKKKKTFLKVARLMGLYKGITWHGTNDIEADEIRHHFGDSVKVQVAPNLVVMPSGQNALPKKEVNGLRLVTIARISPEKNILQAIEWVTKAMPNDAQLDWDIFGTEENEAYLGECQRLIATSGLNIKLKGHITPEEIKSTLGKYHVFYLPTLGENYGHAIMEALMHGLPVLISNMTPWKGLKAQEAGWELPLEEESFVPVLREALEMEGEDFIILNKGARSLGATIANRSNDVSANYELFRSVSDVDFDISAS